MREAYPHQRLAIDLLRQALRQGKKRPVLGLQTGAGKTKIAADIFHMARSKGKRCLFIADAIGLIDQTIEAFWQDGHREIGAIQADHPMTDYAKPIQVASVQTLARRALPDFDLAVIDEVHVLHRTHVEIMQAYPNVPFIGLSATPWSKGLGLHFDCLIQPISMKKLIDMGRILDLEAYSPSAPLDLSHVKIKAGDYDEEQLSIIMRGEKLVADAVETWKILGEGRPTIGYAVDCAHGQHMQDRFNQAGIPAGYIDGKTPAAERKVIQERLETGNLKVVWSVGTLVKGNDWLVTCGIDCQPTKSHMRHVQKCGRVVRSRTGAEHGLWLDHAGNCLRLGMPVDIVRTELCTAKKGEKGTVEAQATRQATKCPKCQRVKNTKVCICGYESKRESDLSEGAGQLARVDGGKAGPKKAEPTIADKRDFYGQARTYAAAKGKSDGWLAHLYRDKFGVWPVGMKDVPPMNVGPEVSRFIQAKNIRFARGMAKRQSVSTQQHGV
jgi:superfamily II DNA or RNA helicase